MKFGTGNVHKNVLSDCGYFEGHKRNYIYACSTTFGVTNASPESVLRHALGNFRSSHLSLR